MSDSKEVDLEVKQIEVVFGRPTIDNGKGVASEVHLRMTCQSRGGSVLNLVVRLKSRREVQQVVDDLREHRDSLWPIR